MRVDYRRDLNSNSLVLWEEEQLDTASYQVRMLMANQLEGFLGCRVHQMDGALLFYYDITSRQSLDILLQHQKITGKLLRLLLESLIEALETLKNYLLSMDDFVLEARFIYMDPEQKQVCFCYLPGHKKSFQGQLRAFGEFLLPRLDNQDREGVVLGYAFYQLAVRENFTAEEIRGLLREGEKFRESGNAGEIREGMEKPEQNPEKDQDLPEMEKRQELLEAFFAPDEEETGRDWKKAGIPGIAAAAAVLLGGAGAWAGGPPAGLAAGLISAGAVLLPYWVWRRRQKAAGEENSGEPLREEKVFEEETEGEEKEPEIFPEERTVYMGPEEPERKAWLIPEEGEKLLLDRQVILLGKNRQYADLQLSSPGVSRLHARMVWNGETYQLGDLNSRNGTWVNGSLLPADRMVALEDGDKIRFGDLTYLYRR